MLDLTQNYTVFVPHVIGEQPERIECYQSAEAALFAQLLINHPMQQRKALTCYSGLVRAAGERALSMGALNYFAHCDPAGTCPNTVARANGCILPNDYGNGNNIESIAAGSPNADAILGALLRSPKHADHLLGRSDFYRRQEWIGVAMVRSPGSRHQFYWSILIAQLVTSGE